MDKCPATAPGTKVTAYGCLPAEKANITLEVLFASGSSQVPPASQLAIQDLATFMKNHTETKVEIQGHTDSTGNKTSNKKLSQEGAQSVVTYLVETLGISPTRLSAYGYGDEKPVASNGTADGRNKNRRVMAIISQ